MYAARLLQLCALVRRFKISKTSTYTAWNTSMTAYRQPPPSCTGWRSGKSSEQINLLTSDDSSWSTTSQPAVCFHTQVFYVSTAAELLKARVSQIQLVTLTILLILNCISDLSVHTRFHLVTADNALKIAWRNIQHMTIKRVTKCFYLLIRNYQNDKNASVWVHL